MWGASEGIAVTAGLLLSVKRIPRQADQKAYTVEILVTGY